MAVVATDDHALPHGVLRTPDADRWTLRRREAPGPLAGAVAWMWAVAWDLEGRPPHEQSTVPHPSAHLVIEDGRAVVHGPTTGRFTRMLSGRGRVVAVRFRAGGLAAFVDHAPTSPTTGPEPDVPRLVDLVDRSVPAVEVVPRWDDALVAAVEAAHDLDDAMDRLAAGLGPASPAPGAAEAEAVVACIAQNRSIRTVEELAVACGHHRRRIERLLAVHVGLGPKAVIRRYRLQDAAAAAQSGRPVDWADLAAQLGYFDQAHLVRHFTEVIGSPPATYARG